MSDRSFYAVTGKACAASLLLGLAACASTGATKTISTLAGSSAGSVAANALSVGGPWGYVVSIFSSALGGFAGDRVGGLFGGKGNSDHLQALGQALASQEPTAVELFGAQDGKGEGGYAQATGPVFVTNAGANCRSFMLVAYKKSGGLGALDPSALKNAAGAVGDAKSSAEKLSDVNSAGDAVSGAKDAAEAAQKAKDTVTSLAPASTPGSAPAPDAPPARPPGKETFGTACKNDKNIWQIVKAKA